MLVDTLSRIALCLEYDGSVFEGWQSQSHGRTAQDQVDRAISAIAGHTVVTSCAGRTDTGVHATVQVVHFDTDSRRPLSAWVRGVNSNLGPSVAVRSAHAVDDRFHARFSAYRRHYRYFLLNRPVRPALLSGRVGWFHTPLDVGRMADAVTALVGDHDFSAFRAARCQGRTPIRRMHHAAVERCGDFLVFDFAANGFLHHMVRNLVGALVYIGRGSKEPGWMADLLQQRDRRAAAPTFPADGLYLCGIEYPPHWPLPDDGRIICRPQIPLV